MKKGITKAILTFGLMFSLSSVTVNATVVNREVVKTDATQESLQKAKSMDFSSATQINIANNTIQDSITETTTERLYKFTLSKAGKVTLDMTSYMQYYMINIYDSEGTEIWYTDNNEWNTSLKYRQDEYDLELTSGVYYIEVLGEASKSFWWEGCTCTGNYMLKTAFTSANESFAETNNEFSKATTINCNSTTKGQIAINDKIDIFCFNITKPGCMNLDFTSYMKYYTITIYDSTGEEVWRTDHNEWNENLMKRQDNYKVHIISGTYYMKVTGYRYNEWDESTGNYTLVSTFTSANESFAEPNNDFSTAVTLSYNTRVTGQIAENDKMDNFKLYVANDTELRFAITSYMKYYSLTIYDSAGKEVWDTPNTSEWNENVGYRSDEYRVTLSKGNYYVKVTGNKYSNSDDYPSTGTYNLSVNQLSSINYASVGKIKDQKYKASYLTPGVTVKMNGTTLRESVDYTLEYEDNYSVGWATVTITGIGNYSGQKQTTFKILPKKVSLTSVKNTAKRAATITWKYDTSVDGYQIYRSTKKNKNFKKIKTLSSRYYNSYQNKKLKKRKTYYYKVRAYKIVNGNKFYGEFSKVKKVKIKK